VKKVFKLRDENYLKVLKLFGTLALAAVFFLVATSKLDNWMKAAILIPDLVASGYLISSVFSLDNYCGVVFVKGTYGFSAMKFLGEHFAQASRLITDFALSLFYGIPYSFMIFDKKNALVHSLVLAGFVALSMIGPSMAVSQAQAPLIAATLLLGLAGYGALSLVNNGVQIFSSTTSVAGVTVIVPGVTVPFWESLIAIALAAAFHEIAHGVMAVIEGIKLRNSGALLLGFLPIGAFVEPDEEDFKKRKIHLKRRVLIAGSMANFLLSMVFLPFLYLSQGALSQATLGPVITGIQNNSIASGVFFQGDLIYSVNSNKVSSTSELMQEIGKARENVGGKITFETSNGIREVTPAKDDKIGITISDQAKQGEESWFSLLGFLVSSFMLIVVLNSSFAVVNVLPLFITDGQRILSDELEERLEKKTAVRLSIATGILMLLVILANMYPLIR
jgi:membrane-associated protease RseP (regulator of RpoE activity)